MPFNLNAVEQALPRPSGFVPGAGMSRRNRSSSSAGGDEELKIVGLIVFFVNLCRVCFERIWGLVVFSISLEGLDGYFIPNVAHDLPFSVTP
jgi:hypothetical protein